MLGRFRGRGFRDNAHDRWEMKQIAAHGKAKHEGDQAAVRDRGSKFHEIIEAYFIGHMLDPTEAHMLGPTEADVAVRCTLS